MKSLFTFIVLLSVPACLCAEMSDKEIMAVVNKVQRAYTGGNKDSLDQLTKLPTSSAVPALLIFFKQNFYTFHPTTETNAEALRIAKMIIDLPNSAGYMKPFFKTPPAKNLPAWYIQQRNNIIDLLILVDGKFSVRMFADQLNDPANILTPKDLGRYLALLNISGAPFSKETQNAAGTTDGIAKWKEWWDANKSDYPPVTR